MSKVRPFKGLRPTPELASKVSSLPYDVMNREEAKQMAEGNPYSFLHICRSEIDLDESVDAYDKKVYEKAKQNLDKFTAEGILIQDKEPTYYVYRQIMDGRPQTGVVACVSVDEYMNNTIKKHEFTRVEKEIDRINHFDYCNANTEPVFLTYRNNSRIDEIISTWTTDKTPVYNFTTEDGITHMLWVIDNTKTVEEIQNIFGDIQYLYIADGHHRSASAAKVGMKRREENPGYTGEEEFNYFMAVIFPDKDLYVMDYNRVVKDLNGMTKEEFLAKVNEKFEVKICTNQQPHSPKEKYNFGMYIDQNWYSLTAKPGTFDDKDPIENLDVSILQKNLLNPILGIEDPRTDKRIDFVGGIRGLKELERRANKDMEVAFSMYPTKIEELISIADAGEIMPPKSTWFEPKLRSGLFIHTL